MSLCVQAGSRELGTETRAPGCPGQDVPLGLNWAPG